MAVYDSHCHLSPDITADGFEKSVIPILTQQQWPINLMMTNHIDCEMIKNCIVNNRDMNNRNIYYNLGVHPWFSHLYSFVENADKYVHYRSVLQPYSKKHEDPLEFDTLLDILPDPIYIGDLMIEFEEILQKNKGNINIGEIGLDKVARIPKSGFLGNHESKDVGLSNYRITIAHQQKVFEEHLKLPNYKFVSIHCVNAQGLIYDILRKISPCNIKFTMHSYTGSLDSAKMLVKLKNVEVWFGVSNVVNLENMKVDFVGVDALLDSRVLVETDLGIDRMKEGHFGEIETVFQKLQELGIGKTMILDNWEKYSK